MTQAELANLLGDALRLWGVEGRIVPAEDGLAVTAGGARCTIARADPPFRWSVQTDARQAEGRPPRPCPSVVSLLSVLRRALAP